jgi:hypothetical protein
MVCRYGCITGDNAGFFHIDGSTKCEGGMEECLNTDAVMEYTRVYPEAVAGDGKYFHFSTETYEAVLVYQPSEDTRALQTVLRVAAAWLFPTGYSVAISPEGVAVWEASQSSLAISLTQEWAGEEIAVAITTNSSGYTSKNS